MATKKNRNAAPAVETAATTTETSAETAVSTSETAEAVAPVDTRTPAEIAKPLFEAYDAASANLTSVEAEASAMVVRAEQARSEAVKAILEGTGRKSFNRNGAKISIVTRVSKDGGPTSYSFKNMSDNALEV